MYCEKCGTKIDSHTNYCPSCGNPQNKDKKKHTTLWIGLGIGGIVILLILSVIIKMLVGINGDTEEKPKDSNTTAANIEKENGKVDSFNTNTFEYEYKVILSGEINTSLDIKDYLPKNGTYFKEGVYSTEVITLAGNEVLGYQDNLVNYTRYMGTYPDDCKIMLAGTYSTQLQQRTDGKNDGIMKILLQQVLENPNGTSYQTVIATEPNTEFHSSDGSILFAPNNFYTVSVEAGIFENCICSIREYQNGTDNNVDVSYYAPGVGCILVISGGDAIKTFYHTEWMITEELTQIASQPSIDNQPSTESNNEIYPEATAYTIELSNGLSLIMPENWLDKYEVVEGAMYYSFYEKTTWESDSEADGYVFSIQKILSCEELSYYPDCFVIGVYNDNGEMVGLIVDYAEESEMRWDLNEESASNYGDLMATVKDIGFAVGNLNEFVACDENTLSEYLPQSLN